MDEVDTKDNNQKNESLLNMGRENGLKRSPPDTEDSLPPSKRPPGKYNKSIKSSITVNLILCLQDAKIDRASASCLVSQTAGVKLILGQRAPLGPAATLNTLRVLSA